MDGASSSPLPHHHSTAAGDDEASGTSFDDVLTTTIADDADNLEAPTKIAADTTAAPTAGVTALIALTADVDASSPVLTTGDTVHTAVITAGVTTASSASVAFCKFPLSQSTSGHLFRPEQPIPSCQR